MVLGTEVLGGMAERRIVARGRMGGQLMEGVQEWGSVLEGEGWHGRAGQCGAGGFHVRDGLPSQGGIVVGWASRWVETGAWRRREREGGFRRWGAWGTGTLVGSVLEGRRVVPGLVMVVGGIDPLAFFGSDVDECVEAQEGGARGVVGVGVEEGEEGGGGVVGRLGVVEEGVVGAGPRGRGRVAEEGRDVHAPGRHDGRKERVDSHSSTTATGVQRDIALDPYERPPKGHPRTHRTQVPSIPLQPINGLNVLDLPRPRGGTGPRRDAFAGCGTDGEQGTGTGTGWGRVTDLCMGGGVPAGRFCGKNCTVAEWDPGSCG